MSEQKQTAAESEMAPGPLVRLLRAHPQTAFDYLEFRSVVAVAAARMAAERATDADHERMTKAFKALVEAHDREESDAEAEADVQFHLATYAASHNRVMEHIMASILSMLQHDVFYERKDFYRHQGVRDMLLAQHKAIYDAVLKGDAQAAGLAAERHIAYVREAMQETRMANQRLAVALRRNGRDSLSQVTERTS
jgi:GntR family transcriptional repressor for pyruvate dehydrogenase complex